MQIKLFVKIGGVEALNDIYNCELCVDGYRTNSGTKFGAKKFIDIVDKLQLKEHISINIETKNGVDNLKDILKIVSGKNS